MCAGATLGHCKIKFTFITILYKYTDFGKYSSYFLNSLENMKDPAQEFVGSKLDNRF